MMKDKIIYSTHEYSKLKYENWSSLKYIIDSPLDYLLNKETPFRGTKSTRFGVLCDNIALDRDQLERDFIYWNENERPDQIHSMKAKKNVEWLSDLTAKAEREKKDIVPLSEIRRADDLINNIREIDTPEAALARDLLWIRPGINQEVVFWTDPETGIEMKGRTDRTCEHCVVDLKIYERNGVEDFPREVIKYKMLGAAVLYMKATGKQEFKWVTVNPNPPYHIFNYSMFEGSEEYEIGERMLRMALNRLKWCKENNKWYGRGSMPHQHKKPGIPEYTLVLPAWYKR